MSENNLHILLIDDDDKIRKLLKTFLVDNKYLVSTASNAAEAKEVLKYITFDLLVIDIMMPGQNGYELTKEIREKSLIPIIHLTAMGETEDRVHGLEIGADDYIGKPFDPKELLLRVKNVIKMNIDPNKLLSSKIGEAELNLNKMTIKIKDKLKRINSSEKKVLMKMLSSPGKIFSRTDIGKIASISKERSIDVMITRLRKKIELDPKKPKYLQTIRGSGYVLWIE